MRKGPEKWCQSTLIDFMHLQSWKNLRLFFHRECLFSLIFAKISIPCKDIVFAREVLVAE